MADELWAQPVTALAALIRGREVSSIEVVQSCLSRIEAVNPVLNAVVTLAPDALDRARAADRAIARGASLGQLHGVPCTIKDSLDTAGLRTTAGTIGWRDRVPDRDATAVIRVKAAGAIVLGKTNTPEFTWSDETDNDVFGRTSNPYDVERTPGGSSGGAAAIVAAGGSPFDIGSDTGDSIRQPAHVCGIAGIKPTQGRVPRTGHWPSFGGLVGSLQQLGPLARRVDDLALLLPILAGPDGEDPHVAPVPLGDPATVDVAGLRVAAFTDNGVRTPTPETIATVADAAAAPLGCRSDRGLGRATRSRRGVGGVGRLHPRRRLRLASATHRGCRNAGPRVVRHARLARPDPAGRRRRAVGARRAGGRDSVAPPAMVRALRPDRLSGDAPARDPPRREHSRVVR
ncbi:MAG TPA: amidase [Candidatus Limnocylindrales bacterium]